MRAQMENGCVAQIKLRIRMVNAKGQDQLATASRVVVRRHLRISPPTGVRDAGEADAARR